MLVENLKKDFYEELAGKRILLVSTYEVDSVCTTKILEHIFQLDFLEYTLVVVKDYDELKEVYPTYRDHHKNVILIGCGSTIDVKNFLNPSEDTIIYILDAHRPVHVLNVYDESMVKMIMSLSEADVIPSFDSLFGADRDDDSELGSGDDEADEANETNDADEANEANDAGEEDEANEDRQNTEELLADLDGENDGTSPGNRREKTNLNNDREKVSKKEWKSRREDILFDYIQYNYYGPPACLFALELAWELSYVGLDQVLCAIVALTDSLLTSKLSKDNYTTFASQIQDHVARITHSNDVPKTCLKLVFSEEPFILLYRHWSVYSSLKLSPYTACRLRTWNAKGEAKFHNYLAEIGLPLMESKKSFSAMFQSYRKDFKDMLKLGCQREIYNIPDLFYGSFLARKGFYKEFCALDLQLAMLYFLESSDFTRDELQIKRYFSASKCLDLCNSESIAFALKSLETYIEAMHYLVKSYIEQKQVSSRGPFLFANLVEGTIESRYFGSPTLLTILARFMLEGIVQESKNKHWAQLPLVCIAPKSAGIVSAVGVPPYSCDPGQNLFGRAFECIAARMKDEVNQNAFDPCVVTMKEEVKEKFVDQLLTALV